MNRTAYNILLGFWHTPKKAIGFISATVLFASFSALGQDAAAPESPTVLTNAQQIAALGTNIPAGRYEARFQGVVIYVSPPTRRLYVQDGNLGVQVNLAGSVAPYEISNLVEVTGIVLGGEPTLRLGRAQATIVGNAPFPKPPLVSVHRLITGEDAFRWTRVRGVVRDMYSNKDSLVLQLMDGGYGFEVVFQLQNAPLPRDWTDAELEVVGHCYPFYSGGHPTMVRFHTQGTNNVRVLSPGIADRFDGRPLLTIAEAAKLPNDFKKRYRVAGTVTVSRPGLAFFMDDGTGAMLVDISYPFLKAPADAQRLERELQTPEPGERVEVIGARKNFFSLTPTLMTSEFRRRGKGEPVKPIEVSAAELQEGRHSGKLVTVVARLVDHREWGTARLRHYADLVLRDESDVFQARWEGDPPAPKWDLQTDTYLRVTGVNDGEGSANRRRSTFKILLRSPADVVPAAAPSFWTRREFRRIALAVGGVTLLAGAWILLQRVQMRRLERRLALGTLDLRASEARKAAVLESALDSIITIDQKGRIIDFNPAAEKMFGYSSAEALGREMAELIIPPALRERHRIGLRRAVETGVDTMVGRRVEVPALRRSGEEFPVELALSRISTEAGPVFTAHIQDISERKRAEAERERALAKEKELSDLKSRFVSMVSHEFRTPLGIITSSAEILDAYLDRLSAAERQSNIRDITDATRHMSRMMEEVLLLGRVEAGKMTCRPAALDLAVFGQRLVDEVTSATNGRCPIQFTAASSMGEAQADESLLRHILTNLLNNAVKYSREGNAVEFRVEARGHLAVFTVSDSGIGIPDADAALLFQAFHRGHNVGDTPGTGLGMTIVKRCVELHGGKIAFESKEGHGTTFVIALPLFANGCANGEGTTQLVRAALGRELTFIP